MINQVRDWSDQGTRKRNLPKVALLLDFLSLERIIFHLDSEGVRLPARPHIHRQVVGKTKWREADWSREKFRKAGENWIQSSITSSWKCNSRLEVKGFNSRVDHREKRSVEVTSQNDGTVRIFCLKRH